jgi:phenylalanyl-tRNA synthetase alpha chain
MIHANMLRTNGIDPDKYSGFAWGMGFDRMVMQKLKIDDIRKLYDGTLI